MGKKKISGVQLQMIEANDDNPGASVRFFNSLAKKAYIHCARDRR